jgi:hypothetical protein
VHVHDSVKIQQGKRAIFRIFKVRALTESLTISILLPSGSTIYVIGELVIVFSNAATVQRLDEGQKDANGWP